MGIILGILLDMKIKSLNITPEILNIIAGIDEFKGTWKVLGNLAPEQLTRDKTGKRISAIGPTSAIVCKHFGIGKVQRTDDYW